MNRADFFKTVPGIAIAKSLDFDSFKKEVQNGESGYQVFSFQTPLAVGAPAAQAVTLAFSTWTPPNGATIRRIEGKAITVRGTTYVDTDYELAIGAVAPTGITGAPQGYDPAGVSTVTTTGWSFFFGSNDGVRDLTGNSIYLPPGVSFGLIQVAYASFLAGDNIFFNTKIFYS